MNDHLDSDEEDGDDQGVATNPLPPDLAPLPDPAREPPGEGRCSTWSVIVRAQGDGSHARAALGELIRRYERTILRLVHDFGWRPSSPTPEDLKQGFITGVIERRDLHKLSRRRGESFSAWLRISVRHFLLNAKAMHHAQKRDESITDRGQFQVLHGITPEHVFERQFAEDTLQCALRRHRAITKDKARFDLWARVLPGTQLDVQDLGELAALFGKTPNAVSAEICRLKKRHRQILREVVADTLDVNAQQREGAATIDRELARMYRALCKVPPLQVVWEDA